MPVYVCVCVHVHTYVPINNTTYLITYLAIRAYSLCIDSTRILKISCIHSLTHDQIIQTGIQTVTQFVRIINSVVHDTCTKCKTIQTEINDWLDLGNMSQFQGMAICMEAMDLEHCFPPQEIAERLTQMCRSKHESNDTECTDKPEELAEDESEENADERVNPPHIVHEFPKIQCQQAKSPGHK